MSISHVKSNTVADMTGTVTVFNSQGSSATVAATDLIRPSDWNSQHSIVMGLAGNTAGSSSAGGTALSLQGGNNITLSGTGGTIVFSGPSLAGYLTTAAQSDHSHGNPTLNLTNLSGTTASASNGLTLSLSAPPAGLTTARASNDAIGLNTAATSVTWTVNSSGISLNAGAYLTTAAQSNHSHGNPTLALTGLNGTTASASNGLTLSLSNTGMGISAGTQSVSTGTVVFSNSNGVTFGMSGSSRITASHNGLTTARASNDAIGLNTAGTSVTWTVNSSGISLNAGAYLTTAANSTHSHGNPTLALTNITGTTASASNGLTLSLSAADPLGGGAALSAGTQSVNTGTVVFANSNGLSFGMSGSNQITASHNALTTARASNDAIGLNTAATSVTWTVNSGGISLDASKYLTTAAVSDHTHASQSAIKAFGVSNTGQTAGNTGLSTGVDWVLAGSNSITLSQSTAGGGPNTVWVQHPAWLTTAANSTHSHGDVSLALTNINGTTASASSGLTLSLSANAGGGGAALSAGTQSVSTGTVAFANSNGITFGMSNSNQITASHNGLTTARASNDAVGLNTAATSVTWTVNSSGISLNAGAYLTTQSAQAFSADASSTFQTLTFQNSNGVSFSNNAGALRVSHALQYTSATSAITASALNTSASRVINLVAATNSTGGGTASQSGNLWFSNANGISFWTSAGAIQARHNALTTARASNDAIGLNTALTSNGVQWTVNSSGISLNIPAFLTTAANSTHSHGNPTLATSGAISGTTASASNGLTFSLSVPPTSSISAGGGISISTTGSTIIIMTV